jgi:hypothetical protein
MNGFKTPRTRTMMTPKIKEKQKLLVAKAQF